MSSTEIRTFKKLSFFTLKRSTRSISEQLTGFFLLFAIPFLVETLPKWLSQDLLLFQMPKSITFFIYFSLSCSLFLLWRQNSIQSLKLESILYLIHLFISSLWLFFSLTTSIVLLSLIVQFFSLATTFVILYVFWKKIKVTTLFLLPLLCYEFYLVYIDLKLCIG